MIIKMEKNNGITIVSLIITIIILLILAGISIGTGNKVIKSSELENVKTNMLLIKAKGKEYVENANFKLGTNFENLTDKEDKEDKKKRIIAAKDELKGEEIEDTDEDKDILKNIGITQDDKKNTDYTYYYKLSNKDLTDMGLSNVKSDEKNGLYIIKYDLKNVEVEVYNTQGFERDGKIYDSLSELQNLNIDF